ECRNADSRDEIEIAATVRSIQPGTFRARNLQPERRIGGPREVMKKEVLEIIHRAAAMKSRNAPPPCGQFSGGDCSFPGSHTYVTPAPASTSRNIAREGAGAASAKALRRPATGVSLDAKSAPSRIED